MVWRASDSTLGREVALKFLPEALASDPERLSRFEREARLLASLNHPHIAAIHGFHAFDGRRFLDMEFVDGETLAARMARGVIAPETALAIARQIADALEAAHEGGIVHRDLKPANVMIAPDGTAKVLDFGLAKVRERETGSASELSQSPTITDRMTDPNVILGTAAYMSPEQARGRAADKRADIWAFGVILFEMLTGRPLFSGETTSDTLAAVLRVEPEWRSLPAGMPRDVRRLLERCLTRDVKLRLRDIGEARIALDPTRAAPMERDGQVIETARRTRLLRYAAFAVAGLAIGAMVALMAKVRTAPSVGSPRRFIVASPNAAGMVPSDPAISPDGRMVAYRRGDDLWVQDLDELAPRRLATGADLRSPFWSPDSREVGFFSGTRLMKVSLSSGPPQVVADLHMPFITVTSYMGITGGSWDSRGFITFTREDDGLMEVPALGGDPRKVLAPDTTRETDFPDPSVLPDGRGVLYVSHLKEGGRIALPSEMGVWTKGKRRVLLRLDRESIGNPKYSRTGHILFERSGSGVWALPFFARATCRHGQAVPRCLAGPAVHRV